jgi:Tol biopolymer transport system component
VNKLISRTAPIFTKLMRYLFILIIIPLLLGVNAFEKAGIKTTNRDPVRGYSIISPALTPDNNKLILVISNSNATTYLAIYEISTGRMFRFNPTSDEFNGAPAYSSDGRMLTFSSGRDDDRNIFVMNADGTGLKQLTHNFNKKSIQNTGNDVVRLNGRPSFAPDGKRIIFARSGVKRQRSMGGEILSNWDIWEIDVNTGAEKKLTDYKFYKVGRPFYLPDGRRFIFSGDGPKNNSGIGPKDFREYEAMYQNNKIFIMDSVKNDLQPVIRYGEWTSDPAIDRNGAIMFIAQTNHIDAARDSYTYDLFLKRGSEIRRVTNKRFPQIAEPFLSFDGKRAVFLASRERGAGPSLFITNIDGTGLKYFELPSWDKIEVVKRPR